MDISIKRDMLWQLRYSGEPTSQAVGQHSSNAMLISTLSRSRTEACKLLIEYLAFCDWHMRTIRMWCWTGNITQAAEITAHCNFHVTVQSLNCHRPPPGALNDPCSERQCTGAVLSQILPVDVLFSWRDILCRSEPKTSNCLLEK